MTPTWTEALERIGYELDAEERADLEEQAKLVAINTAGAFFGTKRSFALLAVALGAELEAARQQLAEKGGES